MSHDTMGGILAGFVIVSAFYMTTQLGGAFEAVRIEKDCETLGKVRIGSATYECRKLENQK